MSDPIYRLQTLARAEKALAQIYANRAASRGAYFALALLFGLLTVGMLTLSAYHALVPMVGEAVAALLVALIDGVLAVVVLILSRNAGPSENEEQLAREMRDMAYAEIGSDIERIKGDLERISSDVRSIRSGFVSVVSTLASGIGPVIGGFTKPKKKDEQSDD